MLVVNKTPYPYDHADKILAWPFKIYIFLLWSVCSEVFQITSVSWGRKRVHMQLLALFSNFRFHAQMW